VQTFEFFEAGVKIKEVKNVKEANKM